jgi:hypothetical protein
VDIQMLVINRKSLKAMDDTDDRAAALGSEQYNEGMKYMAQRAGLQSA